MTRDPAHDASGRNVPSSPAPGIAHVTFPPASPQPDDGTGMPRRSPDRVRVLWPNGHVDAAPTWGALLEDVRRTQVRAIPRRRFRQEMAWRAWVWSRYELDPKCSPREMFAQLEAAGMLKIILDKNPFGAYDDDDDYDHPEGA